MPPTFSKEARSPPPECSLSPRQKRQKVAENHARKQLLDAELQKLLHFEKGKVPWMTRETFMNDPKGVVAARQVLAIIGYIEIKGAISETDCQRVGEECDAALKGCVRGPNHRSGPGANGNGMMKTGGICQAKALYLARILTFPIYAKLYGVSESDLCVSMDGVSYIIPGTFHIKNTLGLHYDHSECKGSIPMNMKRLMQSKNYPIDFIPQSMLTIRCSKDALGNLTTGTVFADQTLEEGDALMRQYCCPDKKGSLYRPLSDKHAAEVKLLSPCGEAGSLVFWNSQVPHKNALEGERLAVPVCCAPEDTRSKDVKKRKLEWLEKGTGTTHYPTECLPNKATEYAYFNSKKNGFTICNNTQHKAEADTVISINGIDRVRVGDIL